MDRSQIDAAIHVVVEEEQRHGEEDHWEEQVTEQEFLRVAERGQELDPAPGESDPGCVEVGVHRFSLSNSVAVYSVSPLSCRWTMAMYTSSRLARVTCKSVISSPCSAYSSAM